MSTSIERMARRVGAPTGAPSRRISSGRWRTRGSACAGASPRSGSGARCAAGSTPFRRLEQLVRWHAAKADTLPSWDAWPGVMGDAEIGRLPIVRRTRATRAVAAEFARQIRVADPAHPDDALEALLGASPWPGPAMVWVAVEAGGVRWVEGG